jgi:hypothetical protein
MKIGRPTLIVGIVATLLVVAWAGIRSLQRFQYRSYSVSCANHFIQLRATLRNIADERPDLILPATDDTRAALKQIFTEGKQMQFGLNLLKEGSTACPESFNRDGSIGYIYIGDDLRLGDVTSNNILILFCPAENHRKIVQHCHGWKLANETICLQSNEEMISELKRALQLGRSGSVAYSRRALSVLEEQLGKREQNPYPQEEPSETVPFTLVGLPIVCSGWMLGTAI